MMLKELSLFNAWAAGKIAKQIEDDDILGFAPYLKMAFIKPLVLHWCLESWQALRQRQELIQQGWRICHLSMFDVLDESKRQEAVEHGLLNPDFKHDWLPDGKEADPEPVVFYSDSEDDELDLTKERKYGTRKLPARAGRQKPKDIVQGLKLDPCQIDFLDQSGADTDADGMPGGRARKKQKVCSKKKGKKSRINDN
jgi:hypothetical protein